jgi:XTP/dITP diphosphohydrolase
MKLVFATNNEHKLYELKSLIGKNIELLNLKDIQCNEEIPEYGTTLESNASEKAFFIYNKYALNCFADDTGLEIEALNGSPGVYSARYAGEQKKTIDNVNKVLMELAGQNNRKARFRCVISLIIDGKETQFEGIVNGKILKTCSGFDGFGYDPIFQPEGYTMSFAEMPLEEKNRISHRGIAVRKLVEYLNLLNL